MCALTAPSIVRYIYGIFCRGNVWPCWQIFLISFGHWTAPVLCIHKLFKKITNMRHAWVLFFDAHAVLNCRSRRWIAYTKLIYKYWRVSHQFITDDGTRGEFIPFVLLNKIKWHFHYDAWPLKQIENGFIQGNVLWLWYIVQHYIHIYHCSVIEQFRCSPPNLGFGIMNQN